MSVLLAYVGARLTLLAVTVVFNLPLVLLTISGRTLAAIVVLTSVAQSGSQASSCGGDGAWPAISSSDPIYSEALEFTRVLTSHDFKVECVAPSKMINTFEGQAGAALYRTDRGSFEVLFLPKPENFDGLQIVERRADGRYLYSFVGPPKPWRANLVDSPRPVFYIKSRNRLIVAFDDRLTARLGSILIRDAARAAGRAAPRGARGDSWRWPRRRGRRARR